MKIRKFLGRGLTAGFALLAACLLALPAALAQNVTGSISGTVKDPAGALVAGATVEINDLDRTQTIRTLITNGAGFYSATQLPLGRYTIRLAAPGFSEQTIEGITLHVNDTLTINGALQVGSRGEVVTITADQQQLNFESAAQASLINGTQVRELVLSSRNYEQLVGLQPGVSYTGGDQIYIGNSSPNGATNIVNFSVNGARTSGNAWTVDGADNVDRGSNFNLLTYPSVDAIAEFKTLRGSYSAEFGRSASGQINVVTKSGTNDLHGSVYEFIRNDIFNANDTLNKLTVSPSGAAKSVSPRSRLRYNDFGYTVGGPVTIPGLYSGREHKTYFFFSQEIRRVITYRAVTLSGVPSLAERQGQFSVAVCANVISTGASAGSCANPGTQNVTNISPTAAAYLKDIYANVPAPDASGTLITQPLRNIFNANQQIARIDQQIGEKVTATFRFINDAIPTQEPGGLFQSTGYPGVNTTSTNAPGRIYLAHVTYAVRPTLLLDGGYAYSQGALLSDPVGLALNANSPDIKPTLLFASTLPRVPGVTFQGGTGISTYGPYRDYSRNHNIFLTLIKTAGSHTLRFGVDYNHYNKRENNAGANAGTFAFTNAGLVPASGGRTVAAAYQQAWANFLTGFVSTYTQASTDVTADIRVNQIEGFVQDDWKATPRLTLNLGVRYSRFNQPMDANHQLTTFDPSLYVAANAPTIDKSTAGNICVTGAPCTGGVTPNAGANLLNGISINGQNSPYGDKVGRTDQLNFAPRIGFAFDLFGNGKTSVRGGYGLAFDSSLFGIYEQNIFQNKPFVNTPTISNTSFDNPGQVAANVSYATQNVRATSPVFHTPYDQQFSFDVQQALPTGVMLDVSYVGSHQVHLLGLVDINQAAPGAYVAAGLGAPVAGGTAVINSTNIGTLNQIRPYRGYNSINSVQTIFGGNYNSLQLSGSKHWKYESLVSVNYTWSRALTDAGADRTGAPQISSNPRAEYGRSNADRTHIFNFNVVYDLPFFHEQHGLFGHLLGGWEVSALGFLNSGLPLNPTTTGLDPAGVGVILATSVSSGRPDRVGDPNSAGIGPPIHTLNRWFNINAFSAVPNGQVRPGNAARSTVNGPGWWRVDPGLYRNVNFGERVHLQLRGEAFNIFNHTNPDTISTVGLITASGYAASGGFTTAGNVTGFRDKRILQLGAKLIF